MSAIFAADIAIKKISRGDNDLEWAGLKRVSDNILATLSEWNRKACIHLTGGEPLLKDGTIFLLNYLDQKPEIEELGHHHQRTPF